MIQRAVIAGGKTGGHLYPGIAVAEEITARNPIAEVVFIGTEDGIESRVLPKLGYRLECIHVSRLKGAKILSVIRSLLQIPRALLQVSRVLLRHRPEVVLGVGGYASGPALLAAWLWRYPTAIQEQNAYPGLTNRWLSRFVKVIYLGFEEAKKQFGTRRTLTTGNPIRRALVKALDEVAEPAAENQDAKGAPSVHILIFGGSQGSRFLNQNVPAALLRLAETCPEIDLQITHQTGLHEEEETRARYAATKLADRVEVLPYIDDMPQAYGKAHLALCRSGALTIAELTAVGLPSLMVPFPDAADNHQEANAQVLADAGASLSVRQADWDTVGVAEQLRELLNSPERLREMSINARELAKPHAAAMLVDHLETLTRKKTEEVQR